MKKIMFLLVVVLVGLQAFGKKGQPILPYGNYSVEDVRTFALSNSEKAEKFRQALIPLVQQKLDESGESLLLTKSHVSWIFDQVVEQEAWLEARQFKNSRWMPDEKVIEFYVSETRYEGATGIFVYGKCSFPLYKVSCANLLEAGLNKVPGSPPVEIERHTVLKVDTIYDTYVKKDTIYEPVWVESPEQFVDSRVEVVHVVQPQPYYEPVYRPVYMPICVPYIPIHWGRSYNNVCVNNSNYYYSSNTVINNTNINNTRIVNNNRRESGGPVGVPGHGDDGGPAGAPGFPAGAPGGAGGHPAGAPGYESGDGAPGGAGGFSARAQNQTVDARTKSASISTGNNRRSSTTSSRSWRSSITPSTGNVSRSQSSVSNRTTSGRTQAVQTKSARTYSNQRSINRTPSSYSSQTKSSSFGKSRTNSFRSSPGVRSSSYGGSSMRSSGMSRSSFSGGSSMRSSGMSGGGASRSMSSSGGRR